MHEDLRRASALSPEIYGEGCFPAQAELFARSWQLVDAAVWPGHPGELVPHTLLEGAWSEPLLLTRGDDGMSHILSNVCTHRGNLLVDAPCTQRTIRCGYHGRRFGLDGRFLSMPECEAALGFPSDQDHLPAPARARLEPLEFVRLAGDALFEDWVAPVARRLRGLPLEAAVLDPTGIQDFEVAAHWALYVDNYLEGFHIPYVHPALAKTLDYAAYETVCEGRVVLQIGVGAAGSELLPLPAAHPDHGRSVSALYFWLFPNLMLNVYPWGLSVNVVVPQSPSQTRVRFLPYVFPGASRPRGADPFLEQVEREDEAIVERVQRGVRARLYRPGRFSPAREAGVHHFHRLLAESLLAPVRSPGSS